MRVRTSPAILLPSRWLWSVLWLMAAAPLADLFFLAFTQRLGTNPQETLLRATGTWTLVLLLSTLAVTPLRQWLSWPELAPCRRMLGLWTFAYCVIHLLGFWAFEHDFVWADVFRDALKRPFVTVGLAAFFLLLPLALTSNRRAVAWLGPRWKKLHRLVYGVALLACLHFFLHRTGKNNFYDPGVALAVTAVLFAARILWLRLQVGRN